MKKRNIATILMSALIITVLSSCGNSSQENTGATVPSGEVTAENDAKETEEDAGTYYEMGRACLYGLDGQEIDLEAAYTNFEKALELGNAEANFYLGLLYDWYSYPEKDYEKARAHYAAVEDDPYAQIALGFLYYYGQGVEEDKAKGQELFDSAIAKDCVEGYLGSGSVACDEEDYDTALECYNKALEGEEQIYIACAMYSIGDMYYYGQGVEQDYAQTMEWYEKAADLGYAVAVSDIGYLYEQGLGVEQDYAKAMEWYEKAANLGYPSAMISIGFMYEKGLGVEQDYAKAVEWYEKAANLGNSSAMYDMGYAYQHEQGVEQDYAKAVEWYEKAANLGNSRAMNNIGYMYQEGLGVEQDYTKAMEWYAEAANLGNAVAMNNIGHMYTFGLGVEQDYVKALECLEKAADIGSVDAMNNIGFMYEKGLGVEQDLSKAQEWYDKAAAAQ